MENPHAENIKNLEAKIAKLKDIEIEIRNLIPECEKDFLKILPNFKDDDDDLASAIMKSNNRQAQLSFVSGVTDVLNGFCDDIESTSSALEFWKSRLDNYVTYEEYTSKQKPKD